MRVMLLPSLGGDMLWPIGLVQQPIRRRHWHRVVVVLSRVPSDEIIRHQATQEKLVVCRGLRVVADRSHMLSLKNNILMPA